MSTQGWFDVRYWPLADIPVCAAYVCFRGKADIGWYCIRPLLTQSGHAGSPDPFQSNTADCYDVVSELGGRH